jgi:ABC-2 type transport system permease protein
MFVNRLPNNDEVAFRYLPGRYDDELKKMGRKEGPQFLLYIPDTLNIFNPTGIRLVSTKNVGVGFNSRLESIISDRVRDLRIEKLNLNKSLIDTLKTSVNIEIKAHTAEGEKESSSAAASGAAVGGGLLIYMFIFLYGGLVLRGVQEEKQNRIVEIIVSSVRPFQLMMGKIVGIALVGLTQFIVWVLLTLLVTTVFGAVLTPSAEQLHAAQELAGQSGTGAAVTMASHDGTFSKVMSAIGTLNLPLLIGMFIFYFLGGYLLYSSMFAAVAAAVDSQSDLYQFMFPISLPIIISISLISSIIENPDSNFSFWMSLIPLTSPVIMMARLPFGVPAWQIATSVVLLIGGFMFTTWLAGKIYRIGILMYGKKITYKELFKWLFY